jgi:hypothetical protein
VRLEVMWGGGFELSLLSIFSPQHVRRLCVHAACAEQLLELGASCCPARCAAQGLVPHAPRGYLAGGHLMSKMHGCTCHLVLREWSE